jgi:hypothetical protein
MNLNHFLVFAALGMLSPSSRGALVTAACFLYVFMGLENISFFLKINSIF